jgi:prepilin-type N-terminal cleavage/methylation domain-containing protein
MSPRPRARRARGFTLLEVLVAGSLLLAGLSGLCLIAITSAANIGQAIEADSAAKFAALLVEEQVALRFANLPAAGTTLSSTQTFSSGKVGTGSVQIIDTSGAVAAGSPNLGSPSRLVRATVSWKTTFGATRTVVNESYVGQ